MSDNDILICIIFAMLGYFASKYFLINGFTANQIMEPSLSDLNNAGCCVSNQSGYGFNPVAIADNSPGMGMYVPYSNPCGPL